MMNTSITTEERGSGQQPDAKGFDVSRAMLRSKDIFMPFQVSVTKPLQEARIRAQVRNGTPVLLTSNAGGAVALLTGQMIHHHVAQGDIGGRPWMIAF